MTTQTTTSGATINISITENQNDGTQVAAFISGTPGVGNALTCTVTGGTPTSYQWTRDDAPISGATSQNYVQQSADRGHVLRCVPTLQTVSGPITVPTPPITLSDAGLSTTLFNTAAPGAVLAAISGGSGGTFSISSTDTSGLFAVSGSNLVAGLNYPATLTSDQAVSVKLTETLAGAVNSPYSSTPIAALIKAAGVGAAKIVPGTTAYRAWAMIDETTLPAQGNAAMYGYDKPAFGQWINGQYNRETGAYRRGVFAAHIGRLADILGGDNYGIAKVTFYQDNGPGFDVTAVTTDPATGIEGFWFDGNATDVAASRTSETRAVVWPKVGKPFVMQGRSAAGPPGQAPTYDTQAGPVLPVAGDTGNMQRQSFDARVYSSGPVNGGTYSTLALMPGAPSMIINLDNGDGLLPQLDMYVSNSGSNSNDGLTAGAPLLNMDGVAAKAPTKMSALFGQMNDGLGNSWNDCGGLRVNLLAGNYTIDCLAPIAMLGAANQWIEIRVAPGVARSAVKITSNLENAFLCEKIRLNGLDFVNASHRPVNAGAAGTSLYGDVQWYDCTFDGTIAGVVVFGPALRVDDGCKFSDSVNGVTQGCAVTMTNMGSGYTSVPTMSTPTHGAGLTFTPVVAGGKVTSVLATGTQTADYMGGEVVTFTGGGGTGATGTLNVLYQGQPLGAPALDRRGGGGQIEVIGRMEVIGRNGSTTPTFKNLSIIGFRGMTTLIQNVLADTIGSDQDILGERKADFLFTIKNTKGFVNPLLTTWPFTYQDADLEFGNHFDLSQPFNAMDGFISYKLDNSVNCNMQGVFADGNGPFRNGAFIRPKVYTGAPSQKLTAWDWGAGAKNVLIVNPDLNGGGGAYRGGTTFDGVRIILTDPAANIVHWENAFHTGVSLVYPTTPAEPYDGSQTLTTDFDAVAPTKLIEVMDANITALMSVTSRGASGQSRLRLGALRDAKNPTTNSLSRQAANGWSDAQTDALKPTIDLTGFHGGQPCLVFTGYNTSSGGLPVDFCLGGAPLAAMTGNNKGEFWTILENTHPTYTPGDTGDRFFWEIGDGGGYMHLGRQSVGGKEHITAVYFVGPIGAGTPDTLVSINTSSVAPASDFTGVLIARLQVLTTGVSLTIYNAANPGGVTVTQAYPSGKERYTYPYKSVLGAGQVVTWGFPSTYAGMKFNARVSFNAPLSSGEASAMLAICKARCGF